ncbi:hypothetical protein [Acetobacter pasteurianus]|uniref:hypothetical protein n=1 Tax=Acetobacter TaxID=434 RepID=UPI000676BFBA|nr:hypothetical protein [Acetobacter pasteurianus]AKR49746.1 hypothetical protein DB34_13315 [Acetobacter pasteurianus]
MTDFHKTNHAAPKSACQPNVVRVKILPIVLVAGVMILGFEIAQQAFSELHAQKMKKIRRLEGPINGWAASNFRPDWVLRLYYASGAWKVVWWMSNPRAICLRLRQDLIYAALWFVWATPHGRKIVKSRKQRRNITEKVRDYFRDAINLTEGQP